MPPALKGRLEELGRIIEADTMSEVVRRSLATYEMLVREVGRTASIVDEDGTVTKFLLY